jgi:hypothetical protein
MVMSYPLGSRSNRKEIVRVFVLEAGIVRRPRGPENGNSPGMLLGESSSFALAIGSPSRSITSNFWPLDTNQSMEMPLMTALEAPLLVTLILSVVESTIPNPPAVIWQAGTGVKVRVLAGGLVWLAVNVSDGVPVKTGVRV